MRQWQKLGIIAGGGALPVRLAATCKSNGDDYYAIRLAGFCDTPIEEFPGQECGIGEAGKILGTLKENGCDAIVFAGMVQRPDFKSLKVDWRGASMLPKIAAAALRGDGAILSALIEAVESDGFTVVGADDVVDSLLAPAGALGSISPSDSEFKDIQKAAKIVEALGPFDVGQGAVVVNGFVVAIEAAEGTDAMLRRCEELGATPDKGTRAGVLVKRPKPGQELRIDLPTIGVETIRRAAAAGLAGVAVMANGALVIDRSELIQLADSLNIFVYGYTHHDLGGQ